MCYIVEIETNHGDLEEVAIYGPYDSHAEANKMMQLRYDYVLSEIQEDDMSEDPEGDDSDASHFNISTLSGFRIDFMIKNPESLMIG